MAHDTNGFGTQGTAPMYASYRVFTGFLDWLAEMPAIPEQLDRSLAGDRYSGSLWSHLMSGLQFLGLAQGAVPKPELEELVKANKEHRKALIETTLRQAYGDDFISRVPRMTPQTFDKHLDELGSSSATRPKAASFLTNALKDTDIEIPSVIAKRARNKSTGTNRRGSARKANATSSNKSDVPELPESDDALSISAAQNVRSLTLRGGQKVSLVADFDVLSVDTDDLAWLLSLLKKFDEYRVERQAEEQDQIIE